LSPHLGTGLLVDHWDELPPLHSPHNPPYVPELLEGAMRPLGHSRLYQLTIPLERPPAPPTPAQISPLDPARLATDLLPLLEAACPSWGNFVLPDAKEAAFLLRWVGRWPLYGRLAQIQGEPAGFVLLGPDLSLPLRQAGGGRNLLGRLWFKWRSRRPVRRGRLLYGGVSPRWRGQGIGHQLMHQALVIGQEQGWRTLSIGPIPSTAPACAFLAHQGAHPRQTYVLYQRNL
jgi:ribosomal protein S18 acetylase RimI-like enzyme